MTTPMFRQFHALKAEEPDAILMFRMGDFYEMFFEDAEIAAPLLELTLTARNKQDPNPVPMAGVPHHAVHGYIQRLVEAGYRVALADQVEDPRLAKGLVRREIVRVVTPGVALDPTSLTAREPNWLAGVCRLADRWGVALFDASTGDLRLTVADDVGGAALELSRHEPREVLFAPGSDDPAVVEAAKSATRSLAQPSAWEAGEARRELHDVLGVHDLAGFGVVDGMTAGVCAAGALLRYVRDTQKRALGNVHTLHAYQTTGLMVLDDTSRRNLELTRTLIGSRRKGSLLWLMDRSVTPMGSRMLKDWIVAPLLDLAPILGRQSAVAALVDAPAHLDDLRSALKSVVDIERIGTRVVQGTAHARDLAGLRASLASAPQVARVVAQMRGLAAHAVGDLCADVASELDRVLLEDPAITLTEGGLIREGVNAELDELTALALQGVDVLNRFEATQRKETGISSLKVRSNRVFGYFIEVSRANLHRVPDRYLRKQTLSNCERYITPELKELEEKLVTADERRKALEYDLFVTLRDRVADEAARLSALARRLAALDALAALAQLASHQRWCRPVVDTSDQLTIVAGRHPVVEAMMEDAGFVPNDVTLDREDRQLIILTGPNMSGKSTIMRQVALITLLAQMGSFVPADAAHIGICDRIFTRVGAADDLARGQSTFMVEMSETSAILHGATPRSLVVLDEIGRGTSTYDGLSIAWAVAEDLATRIRCRTMFATHYHELCELAATRRGVVNQSVAVAEHGDRIVFLRRLKEGGASRSYGIQCARLAGLPEPVIARARTLLTRFEKHGPRNEQHQLSLFGAAGTPDETEAEPPVVAPDVIREAVANADPDALSPRQAHSLIYHLKELLSSGT
ncbi:MAG: DNA mismatch repair protein MutS [Myxococcota bacterium]